MTREELTKWFCDKFNSCYQAVLVDDNGSRLFWFYDKNFIRKKKLCKIENIELHNNNEVKGVCLFDIYVHNRYIYCDSEIIWGFFGQNYSKNYIAIQSLINEIIEKNIPQLRNYVPQCSRPATVLSKECYHKLITYNSIYNK